MCTIVHKPLKGIYIYIEDVVSILVLKSSLEIDS